ncbi:MAG: hypothetical protein ACK5KO_00505 [Arachnia sp.]
MNAEPNSTTPHPLKRVGQVLTLFSALLLAGGGVMLWLFFSHFNSATSGPAYPAGDPIEMELAAEDVRSFIANDLGPCQVTTPEGNQLVLEQTTSSFSVNNRYYYVAGPLTATTAGTYSATCEMPVWLSEESGLGVSRFVLGLVGIIVGFSGIIFGPVMLVVANSQARFHRLRQSGAGARWYTSSSTAFNQPPYPGAPPAAPPGGTYSATASYADSSASDGSATYDPQPHQDPPSSPGWNQPPHSSATPPPQTSPAPPPTVTPEPPLPEDRYEAPDYSSPSYDLPDYDWRDSGYDR